MGGLLHLVQRGGAWRAGASPSPLLAVPSVTAHPSTANIPTSYRSIWHYNCLCTLYRINRFTSMTSLRRNLEVLNTATLTTSTASRHSGPQCCTRLYRLGVASYGALGHVLPLELARARQFCNFYLHISTAQ